MAKNIVRDESGVLKKLAIQVVKDTPEFLPLKQLHFLYTWWTAEEPEKDPERAYVAGSVRKVSVRERDLYGRDVEFRVNRAMWESGIPEWRYRLVWHELCHVSVTLDEDLNVVLDDDGRVKFMLLPHDVVIKTFSAELDKFGLPADLVYPSQVVTAAYRKYRKERETV